MSQTCLVTGGAGFVGRQILRALAERDIHLRLVLRAGQPAPDVPVERIVRTPDLFAESAAWWRDACDGVDIIVHAAWYAKPGRYLEAVENLACLSGTLALAQGAADAGVGRFVGLGTCFEYDLAGGEPLAVDAPLLPRTLYAATKAASYLALQAFFAGQPAGFAWCRLFYLYGEGEDERRFVPYLRRCLADGVPAELTEGTQVRDYLDVRDAGAQIAEAALSDRQGALNICSGMPVSLRALAERLADAQGRRDLLRFGARPTPPHDPPYVVGIPSF